ncbi:uncharacterized protein LOC135095025 isoform X2 [Scylla paramamosain]|uniref:uncharacterized protein LOC135095025 isoform X2 n=1 Tax=Scylla paramamosain TaxID=85552 RepID=UPI003082F04E
MPHHQGPAWTAAGHCGATTSPHSERPGHPRAAAGPGWPQGRGHSQGAGAMGRRTMLPRQAVGSGGVGQDPPRRAHPVVPPAANPPDDPPDPNTAPTASWLSPSSVSASPHSPPSLYPICPTSLLPSLLAPHCPPPLPPYDPPLLPCTPSGAPQPQRSPLPASSLPQRPGPVPCLPPPSTPWLTCPPPPHTSAERAPHPGAPHAPHSLLKPALQPHTAAPPLSLPPPRLLAQPCPHLPRPSTPAPTTPPPPPHPPRPRPPPHTSPQTASVPWPRLLSRSRRSNLFPRLSTNLGPYPSRQRNFSTRDPPTDDSTLPGSLGLLGPLRGDPLGASGRQRPSSDPQFGVQLLSRHIVNIEQICIALLEINNHTREEQMLQQICHMLSDIQEQIHSLRLPDDPLHGRRPCRRLLRPTAPPLHATAAAAGGDEKSGGPSPPSPHTSCRAVTPGQVVVVVVMVVVVG